MSKEDIQQKLETIQDQICKNLEQLDESGKKFKEDIWQHPEKGGGKTRIFQGDKIEKGGVNFSAVEGKLPRFLEEKLKIKADFFATGVSIVLHPRSPLSPIIHANIRYFEAGDYFWVGGGIDLSPHYIDKKLAEIFHQDLYQIAQKFDERYYPDFKKQADDYFFLAHRNETRGIGGIFFDYLGFENYLDQSKEQLLNFIFGVGEGFFPIYEKQIRATEKLTYTEEDLEWQKIRRGRYVEFNLIWDRGTKFGLETAGRTESILMSLPPLAAWEYQYDFQKNPKAVATQNLLKKDINWLAG